MSTERLRVNLAGRSYEIVVGSGVLASAGREIASLRNTKRVFIVSDENVAAHHLQILCASLEANNIGHITSIIPPGEASKSFSMLERIVMQMLDANLERNEIIIALGGGVVGDLAGFAAGIVKRGLDYVQIPTTLLSQVDSSVGGKTAIDTPQGKNLVGLFHQPIQVLADTATLETLPPRELKAGYAEVLKYGLISDKAFADWLTDNVGKILSSPSPERTRAILTSCNMKARVVEADERESGQRALLNLGHTFGHALEACQNYSGRLLHGEAVAVGCVLAFELSEQLNLCARGETRRVQEMFAKSGLPTSIRDLPEVGATPEDLIHLMLQDKKAKNGELTLVLAHGIGKAFVASNVSREAVHTLLAKTLNG